MPSDRRRRAAGVARRLARTAFGAAIILSPFRAGILLAARPQPPIYTGYTDFVAAWSEVAVVAALALWGTSIVLDPRPIALPRPSFLRWPAAALLVLAVASASWSIDPALSVFNAGEIVVMACLAVYVLNEVDSLEGLVVPLAAMVAVQAVVGIGQVLVQRSVGLAALGEPVLDPARKGVSVVATSAADRLLRAYGLTEHPNILGGLLVFALLLLGAGLLGARQRTRMAGSVVLVAGLCALVLTFSRAAWLALAAGLLVAPALQAYRRDWRAARRWAGAGLAGATLAGLMALPFAPYLGARVSIGNATADTEIMSTGERAILIGATGALVAAHPLGGTGLATLPLAISRANPGLTFDDQPASVVVLDVAAELGVFAALCYGSMLFAPMVALWRLRGRWTPSLIAASAALVASGVVGLFDYYTWTFAAGRIWAWLLLGLWAGMYAKAAGIHAAA